MNINELKVILENIIHSLLYKSSKLSKKDNNNLEAIIKYLQNSDNLLEDLRLLMSTKTNENYYMYDQYLNDFLVNLNKEQRLSIIYNQTEYEEVIKDNSLFLSLWNTLDIDDKLSYLKDKKRYNDTDILFINEEINNINLKDNEFLATIIKDNELIAKIPSASLHINCSYSVISLLNLNNNETCRILTKESFTKILLKKCKNFEDFYNLYTSNKEIYDYIEPNGLIFNNVDNENIYNFLLTNPNFIGKFNHKYLDLFNIIEITKISKDKHLDDESFSSIIQKLYKYNNEDANTYFSLDNLKRCPKDSISVYPFEDLSKDLQTQIFNDYSLFNRFIDTIIIEAINNKFSEEDIVNNLRDDNFINDTSSYAIELLINKLSFKAAFNMLQRKIIFDKINNLHIKVTDKDAIFVKGFLDSPILIYKSEHNMVYEMLNLLDSEDVLYFITLPYILDKLSNYEIINLCLNKKLNINKIFDIPEILNTFNTTDTISYIDRYFEEKIDLKIFKNRQLIKKLFNLSDDQINEIDFDEVSYLYETIRMKSLLSKQDFKPSVLSYKSTLISYLTLGLDETLKIVNNGNMNITLNEIQTLQHDIINERILIFKENNSSIFQNMAKKIINNLKNIEPTNNINEFANEIRKNTYLDNVIYIMLDNNFDTYNSIIDKFYDYLKYSSYDNYNAKKQLYDYTNAFTTLYIDNKYNEYNSNFDKLIMKNFKPKERVIYTKRKEFGNLYINKLKFKLFVRALTDPNKESYIPYFKDNYPIDKIKDKYLKLLASKDVDFDSILEHVLTPIINDRFDKENCLNHLGIKKPKDADIYIKYLQDINSITELNAKIERLRSTYKDNEVLEIMNTICYQEELSFKITPTTKKLINKYQELVKNLNGEIYIDKNTYKFIYKDNIDIYNIDEIIEYNNYIEILDDIITKTANYANRNISTEKVKNAFNHDYLKALEKEEFTFPITTKYYELKKRVLSLKDIENIFNGYDLLNYQKIDDELKTFLIDKKNLIMVADGYYDGIVDNLGVIISKWPKIKEYITNLDLDINSMTLINIENILTLINFDNNPLSKILDKNIIKATYDDGYYEVLDLNKRIEILMNLFKDSFKRISSTIPYLNYIDNDYEIKVLDNYNQDILKSIKGSLFKVGAIGNDFLHYSILDKNGIQLGIYYNNTLVAKILGLRNGNTLYLNALEGCKDTEYNELLRNFAMRLISITKDNNEPIEYVTIVNNNIYQSRNGLNVDTTLCPIINNPINKVYIDYDDFASNKNLLNPDDIYTNYEDNISTLLASNDIVDKNNFKYYDADAKYLRKRNTVIKLSNNIGEEYLDKISAIMYLWQLENPDELIEDVSLSVMKTIYLGDDFVLFVTEKNNYIKYILPYDERASKEVNLIINTIEEN